MRMRNVTVLFSLVLLSSLTFLGCGDDDGRTPDPEAGDFSCEDSEPCGGFLGYGCHACVECGLFHSQFLVYDAPLEVDSLCIAIDFRASLRTEDGNMIPCENPQIVIEDEQGVVETIDIVHEQIERIRVVSPSGGRHTVSLTCTNELFPEHGTWVAYWANGLDSNRRHVHPDSP